MFQQENNKTRSSLFRKNSGLTANAFSPRKESGNETRKKSGALAEEQRKADKKRGTVLNAVSIFNERKFLQQKAPIETKFVLKGLDSLPRKLSMPKLGEKNKFLEDDKTSKMGFLTQRKSSIGNVFGSKKNVAKLQKDLFKYELANEKNDHKVLKNSDFDSYLNKNIRSIDSEVRRLLDDFKASKIKDFRSYFTNLKKNSFFSETSQKGQHKKHKTNEFAENHKKPFEFFLLSSKLYFCQGKSLKETMTILLSLIQKRSWTNSIETLNN